MLVYREVVKDNLLFFQDSLAFCSFVIRNENNNHQIFNTIKINGFSPKGVKYGIWYGKYSILVDFTGLN